MSEVGLILAIGVPLNFLAFAGYYLWRIGAVHDMSVRILDENSRLYDKLPSYDKMLNSFGTSLKKFEREARKKFNDEM